MTITDAGDIETAVLLLLVGAAVSHNFGLASSGSGATSNGMIAVGVCALILAGITFANINRKGANA